jgi:hypothetical protein
VVDTESNINRWINDADFQVDQYTIAFVNDFWRANPKPTPESKPNEEGCYGLGARFEADENYMSKIAKTSGQEDRKLTIIAQNGKRERAQPLDSPKLGVDLKQPLPLFHNQGSEDGVHHLRVASPPSVPIVDATKHH